MLTLAKQIARCCFSQTSVNKFLWGFSYFPYHQDVCNSEVSARWQLIECWSSRRSQRCNSQSLRAVASDSAFWRLCRPFPCSTFQLEGCLSFFRGWFVNHKRGLYSGIGWIMQLFTTQGLGMSQAPNHLRIQLFKMFVFKTCRSYVII